MFTNSTFARTAISVVGAALLASTCMIVAVAPAAAAMNNSITVSSHDLDLTQPHGRGLLVRRITSAARSLCRTDDRSLAADARRADCIQVAVNQATRGRG